MQQIETTQRATNIIQKLEETKMNFKKQILAIVEARIPFNNVGNNDVSNLAAINALTTSPKMMNDAKVGTTKLANDYATTHPGLAQAMSAFSQLLDSPDKLVAWRDKIHDKLFHPDKEEVKDYLFLIDAYIDKHIDQYIDFVKAIDADSVLQEKFNAPGGFLHVSSEEAKQSLDNVMQFRDIQYRLLTPLAAILIQANADNPGEKTDNGIEFSAKGLQHILNSLVKYGKMENELLTETSFKME